MPGSFYPQAQVFLQAVFDGFGGGQDDPTVVPLTPISCSVHRNSYKEADTFEVEFDQKDLPILPEQIRASAIEIHLFLRKGLTEPFRDARGKLLVGRPPAIAGLVDDVTVEMSDSGKTVSVSGKDYTALFLEKQWPQVRAPMGRPIADLLRDMISDVDPTGRLSLRVDPPELEATLPNVGKAATRVNKKGVPVPEGKNYWDVMYEMAGREGFILFVEGLEVVLSKPHVLVESRAQVIRKLAWGKNLERLTVTRHMGRETIPQIQVNSYDDKTMRTYSGIFPAEREKTKKGGTEKRPKFLNVNKQEIRVYTFHGISSESVLRQIAETLYNLVSRGEQSVQFETADLLDLEGEEMLTLRSGDAVSIAFDAFSDKIFTQLDVGERITYLLQRGYKGPIAKLVAENYELLDLFRSPFRFREGTIDWDKDNGIRIEGELIEFVNVREAASAATGFAAGGTGAAR